MPEFTLTSITAMSIQAGIILFLLAIPAIMLWQAVTRAKRMRDQGIRLRAAVQEPNRQSVQEAIRRVNKMSSRKPAKREHRVVQPGDRMRIGSTEFTFVRKRSFYEDYELRTVVGNRVHYFSERELVERAAWLWKTPGLSETDTGDYWVCLSYLHDV